MYKSKLPHQDISLAIQQTHPSNDCIQVKSNIVQQCTILLYHFYFSGFFPPSFLITPAQLPFLIYFLVISYYCKWNVIILVPVFHCDIVNTVSSHLGMEQWWRQDEIMGGGGRARARVSFGGARLF